MHRSSFAALLVTLAVAGCASGGGVEASSSGAAPSGGGADAGEGGASSGDGGAGNPASVTHGSTSASDPSSSDASSSDASTSASSSTETASSSTGSVCDDESDCPASGTLCRTPVCDGGICSSSDAARGSECADSGGTVCDGAGMCAPATCTDGLLDGAEIGIDCGGGTCPGCIDGTACAQPADCASGACVGNLCVACGGNGQPCCAGSTCDAVPSTCAGNTATLWGGTAEECNCGVLRAGQVLRIGEARWSCDGRFQLVMQGDGNLVLYFGSSGLWSSNTSGTPATRAVMQVDGNFVVFDDAGQPWWESGTSGAVDGYLAIQDDANVVLYDAGGAGWWSTDTCCI